MTRTRDLLITNQLHYRLCYTSIAYKLYHYYLGLSSICKMLLRNGLICGIIKKSLPLTREAKGDKNEAYRYIIYKSTDGGILRQF